MEGVLSKWTNGVKGWQNRYFLLDPEQGHIAYYTALDKKKRKTPRGIIKLKDAFVGIDEVDNNIFTINCSENHKIFYLQAKNSDDLMNWVREIEDVISSFINIEELEYSESIKALLPAIKRGKTLVESLYDQTSKLRSCLESPDLVAAIADSFQNNLDSLAGIFSEINKKLSEKCAQKSPENVDEFCSAEFFDCDGTGGFDEVDEDMLYGVDDRITSKYSTNQSIIKHLLKQVKIGMDLTKITLPTFILERRSLLEMLGDFFSHCDLFAKVTTHETPRERMVEMVRAYLSCFHAGRNPEIAKKPYNPILGEIFRCHWSLGPRGADNRGSPLPWTGEGDMTFLVEQVSHHPPVSAFFAENRANLFSFEGQIWTKSRFLGFSVGVEMVGETRISLGQHNEVYTISFPAGYARSILTVPWFEMGGKVELKASTGYYASVNFHTKSLYKGARNEVTAEIFAPSEKSPYCTVRGNWNGVMTASYGKNQEQSIFFDTSTPVQKKNVQPLKQQEPNESRRLWFEVTKCLYNDDLRQATMHKHELEERQRAEKRQRDETGVEYKPKYFELVGELWRYSYRD